MDDPDAEGAIVGRHRFNFQDLAGHGRDGRAPFLQQIAGVAGPANGSYVEACDRVASGDGATILACRLGDQHIFVLAGLGLDELARGRRAHLLVRREEKCDGQRRLQTGARNLPDGFEADVVSALHILNAGTVAAPVLDAPWVDFERADRVHRIQVS